MEHRVESLMRSEVLLYYEKGFTSPKRPYQEEFEGKILKLIDDQEGQIKQLEEDMRKTKDTFMCLTDSLIATLKNPSPTPNFQSQNVNTHSFEENKLEYEDEDEVEIKMMGTRMDKESLEHNLYEDNMTPIICHNFSPTSNPPIKLKDSGNFRMKVIFDEKKLGRS
ncbi:hypothetical protein Tco_0914460 [Tanacetum coccineum]